MQQQPKILKYYLLFLLVFMGIGGRSVYAACLSEIKKGQPFPTEKVVAANPISSAYRENPFQEISELLKDLKYLSSFDVSRSAPEASQTASGIDFSFRRDLRKDLRIQLFPKHFFL